MMIDQKKLQEAAELSDKDFGNLIYNVLLSLGMSSFQAKMASGKAHLIKEKLKSASPKELEMYASFLDEKTANTVLDTVKKGGKIHG